MNLKILDFEERYAKDFKLLNLHWLDQYKLTEAADLEVLNKPKEKIIDQGGFIFIALADNKVIGTAALIRHDPNSMELAKMTVHPDYQGKGISKLLMDKCLHKAKELRVKRLSLFSSTKLKTALMLYEKYGFTHVPVKHSPYHTADVQMELKLNV